MNQLALFAAVGAGGAIGSMLRFAATVWISGRAGAAFPFHTMAINVVGSFLIGAIAQYTQTRVGFSPAVTAFAVVGVLGGFTTFSTFSYDTLTLLADRASLLAFVYCAGSVAFGLAAAFAGIIFARLALHA